MELERDVENYLKQQVKKLGGLSYKFVSPGQRGVPDQIVILSGGVFFVEVKKADGALRATQEVQISKMLQHHARVFVVWSKENVDKALKRMIGLGISSTRRWD